MPVVRQVVGPSGSGKTLVLERAIALLKRRGFRVAVLKHAHHPLAVRGKDTDRLRRSGSDVVVFASNECVIFSDWEPVALALALPVDVLLVEGFHRRRFPGQRFAVPHPSQADRIAAALVRSVGDPPPRPRRRAGSSRSPVGKGAEREATLTQAAVVSCHGPGEGLRRVPLRRRPPRPSARSRREARP